MAGNRAVFDFIAQDGAGNLLTATTFNIYKLDGVTAISDSMFAGATGATLMVGDATKTITSDATTGRNTCYFDTPGVDVPGQVRVKGPSVDQIVDVVADPQDIIQGRPGGTGSALLGPVRTDFRSYLDLKSGSDHSPCFVAAIAAADEVYLPPGIWNNGGGVAWDVPEGKTFYSEPNIQTDATASFTKGAVVKATAAITAAANQGACITLSGGMVRGVNADANALAESAYCATSGTNRGQLFEVRGGNGTLKALFINGSQFTVRASNFAQAGVVGRCVVYANNKVDLIMSDVRMTGGSTVFDCIGGYGLFTNLHPTGRGNNPTASTYILGISGGNNLFDNIYIDNGNTHIYFSGGAIDNQLTNVNFTLIGATANTNPVILLDNTSPITRCAIDNWFVASEQTSGGAGAATYMWQETNGSSVACRLGDGALRATAAGAPSAFFTAFWSSRPAFVGKITDQGGKTSRIAGLSAPTADGGTFNHGLFATPTFAMVNAVVAGEIATVAAAGLGATAITVDIKKNDGTAGTTQQIMRVVEV